MSLRHCGEEELALSCRLQDHRLPEPIMILRLFVLLFALLATTSSVAVDINQASQAELESLKGVGPALSDRILAERKKAYFKDWQDLIARVHGVGAGSAARLSSGGLTVNGRAFVASPAAAASGSGRKSKPSNAGRKAASDGAVATD
jgi:competence protein ComEA